MGYSVVSAPWVYRGHRYVFLIRLFILLLVLLLSKGVPAQQAATPDSVAAGSETEEESKVPDSGAGLTGSVVNFAEGAHDYLSGGLEATAKSVDQFFAEDNVFEESTKSYLRLSFDSVWREYEGFGFAGDMRLKLDLPNTRKRLKLLIESDGQRGGVDDLEEHPSDVTQGRNYALSVEKVVSGLAAWNVRPSLGLKVRAPVDLFVRLRSHRYFTFSDWLWRLSSSMAWFNSSGYEAVLSMAFDRPLQHGFLFRYAPALSWREEEMFRRINQGLFLYQQIDERQKMAYQITAEADDDWDEWRSKRYDIAIRYRRNLYKKWLFGEIIPQWTFLKENDFHVNPSLTFRLETVFGERYR